MRKFFKIFTITLAILIALTTISCKFIDDSSNIDDGGHRDNSIVAGTQVQFASKDEADRVQYSLVEAVEKVARTSVAIEISNESGGGSGTGVIIDVKEEGNFIYVLTCHHVISGGGNILVKIPDEDCCYDNEDYYFTGIIDNVIHKDKAVTLVGGDNVSDIAVLKIDLDKNAASGNKISMEKIQKAYLPSSEYKLRKGESIFAIGNPTGKLPGSVADGVVSYLNREILVSEVGYMELMQISVATNPGNSGGGLYNLYGELVGITNAGNTSYDEINFAIPVESANGNGFMSIASQLIGTATETNYGYISGRWSIGISVEGRTAGFNEYIVVVNVIEGSNAGIAGIQKGDIITAIAFEEKSYAVTPSNFSNYVALMRTTLKKNDSFVLYITRGQFYQESKEFKVNISVADYIFNDTGN